LRKAVLVILLCAVAAANVCAAELPERWVYVSTNLMLDDDADAFVRLIGDAAAAGVTHVHFSDYQSGMMGDMPPRYFANVARVKKAADAAGIVIAPAIFPLGMSGRYLYHNPNLADGIPVRNMRFVVRGGKAVVDPSLKVDVANAGFDGERGTAPASWRVDIGPSGTMTRSEADEGDKSADEAALREAGVSVSCDSSAKHSGTASLRVTAAGDVHGARRLRAGVSQIVKVKPFYTYRLSVWMKTEGGNPERHPVQIYGLRDKRQLCFSYFMKNPELYWPPVDSSSEVLLLPEKGSTWATSGTDFGLQSTDDWAQYKVAFNSLDYDEIELFAGFSRVAKGTIWFDDIEIEPAGLLNVLRRDLTPLVVTSADGKTTFTETIDYKRVEDPLLGVAPSRGDFMAASHGTYDVWHEPPSIALTEGSRIRNSDTLLVSFYSPGIIYVKQQVTASMSDPMTFDLMEQEMKWVARVWNSSCYVMSYDEIRSGGWEPQPGGAHLTPGQLLANHMKRAVQIAHKYAPDAKLYVWSDMFDPNHNARELKSGEYYYLVNGSWAGSWEGLPKDVIIYNWSGRRESAKWFADRGNRQVLSGSSPERWLDAARGLSGIVGMSYTNWEGDYSGMADYFARMRAWKGAGEATVGGVLESTGK